MKQKIIAATLVVAALLSSCSPDNAGQRELCKTYKIYHNEKTDCFIYKLRGRKGAYFICRHEGNYYINAEANLYRTRLMYKMPAYPTQEAALQGAITLNRFIPLDDDLSLSNGQGRRESIKNSVKTICD
jgi:hypothetical protein